MTMPHFGAETEAGLLRQYLDAVAPRRARWQRPVLVCACREVRAIGGAGDSVLDHAHSTTWIRPWLDGPAAPLQARTQEGRIWGLRAWWAWLFAHGELDDNVLACFNPVSDVLRTADTPLVLTSNLQRAIATYLTERGPGPALSNRHLRFPLTHFNVFLNRQATDQPPTINEAVITGWLSTLSQTKTIPRVTFMAGALSAFLDFLVDKGRLPENPLALIWKRGPTRLCSVEIMLGRAAPTPTAESRFISRLAPHLEQFLSLKRAMGRKYAKVDLDLQRFDRFVASHPGPPSPTLSRELVEDWLLTSKDRHPRTKKKRVWLIRQFAGYLARLDPATYVPDRRSWPSRLPAFRAHIYSDEEYRALLKAALDLPSPRSPLRPRTLYTLLLVLYATGLRVGEATRVRLSDVNLEACTFLIRETKFFKSRLVPFSADLAEQIQTYLQIRQRFAPASPESALFVNNRRRALATSTVANTFRRLLARARVPHRPTFHRPRLHDARHTFACTRVLRWYRDGVDVTAKLPLLATYMGHVSVLSTQTYLNATVEMLGEASQRFETAFGTVVMRSPEVAS
jgi:site-specific recombinase XerD